MKEIYKPVEGYEQYYQISNLGNIKGHSGRILTATDNGKGYKIVGLRVDGNRKSRYIHRLVAKHFIDNPQNKRCVNHIDGNKNNNCVNNLEWVTYAENMNHAWQFLGFKKPNNCKLTGKFIYDN